MQIRRPSLRLLAAAGLAALLPVTAQALDIGNQTTAHVLLAPGLHIFDTPQVFGPDSVLELVQAYARASSRRARASACVLPRAMKWPAAE